MCDDSLYLRTQVEKTLDHIAAREWHMGIVTLNDEKGYDAIMRLLDLAIAEQKGVSNA